MSISAGRSALNGLWYLSEDMARDATEFPVTNGGLRVVYENRPNALVHLVHPGATGRSLCGGANHPTVYGRRRDLPEGANHCPMCKRDAEQGIREPPGDHEEARRRHRELDRLVEDARRAWSEGRDYEPSVASHGD